MPSPDLFFVEVDRTLPNPEVTLWRRGDKPEAGSDWEDEFGFWKTVKQYTVAIGAKGFETPKGPHYIRGKALNPAWKMPDSDWVAPENRGKVIPGGDPQNPLKAAFISLGGNFEDGIGFHGTANLDSLGTAASHGCIRMAPEDVLHLYRRVSVGTLVFIHGA